MIIDYSAAGFEPTLELLFGCRSNASSIVKAKVSYLTPGYWSYITDEDRFNSERKIVLQCQPENVDKVAHRA